MLFSEIVEKLGVLSHIDLISCKHDEDITSIQFIDNKSECYNENTLYFSNNLQLIRRLPDNCIIAGSRDALPDDLQPNNLALVSESDFGAVFNRSVLIIEDSLKDGYYEDMMNTINRVKNVDALIDIAAQTFGAPLVLIDRDFRVLSYSTQVPVVDELWAQNIERGYCDYEFIQSVKSLKSVQMADSSMMPIEVSCPSSPFKKFSCRVYCRDVLIGSLIVIEGHDSFRLQHVEMLRILSGVMGYAVMNYAPHILYRTNDYHSLLYNLIIGAEPSSIPDAYSHLTFPSEMRVLYCKATEHGKSFPNENIISERLTGILQECHVISLRDHAAIIGSTEILKKAGKILSTFPEDIIPRIGVSLPFSDIFTLKTHYDEAVDALEIGYMLEPENKIYTFEDFGYYRMLVNIAKEEDLSRYLHPALKKLSAYDQANSSDLIPTLYEYLNRSCNTTDTAEALFLHRNSVIYRIHRIEELCDIDLDDTETRFRLRLSFVITEVLNGKRRRGHSPVKAGKEKPQKA